MPTIADVARRAGVSITTVSRVLSPGSPAHPVSAEAAQRVRRAAAELDFVPSALASGLATRRSGLLGLVVPDLADPHYPLVARGAEERARREGLALLVCNTLGRTDRLEEYLRLLRGRRVDGLVLSGGGSLTAGEVTAIRATGLPTVLIGRPSPPDALPYVAVDNQAAAAEATVHLAALGKRRIVHLGGSAGQTTMADRAQGYESALARHGLTVQVVATDGSAEEGFRATERLLDLPPDQRPDALFAATDRLAVAALRAALKRGLQLPRDLALVGFDDVPLAAFLCPSLSSVAQPARELGEAAIQLALAAIGGSEVQSLRLPARLVVRESSIG